MIVTEKIITNPSALVTICYNYDMSKYDVKKALLVNTSLIISNNSIDKSYQAGYQTLKHTAKDFGETVC